MKKIIILFKVLLTAVFSKCQHFHYQLRHFHMIVTHCFGLH
jgi:hypothetical protein